MGYTSLQMAEANAAQQYFARRGIDGRSMVNKRLDRATFITTVAVRINIDLHTAQEAFDRLSEVSSDRKMLRLVSQVSNDSASLPSLDLVPLVELPLTVYALAAAHFGLVHSHCKPS